MQEPLLEPGKPSHNLEPFWLCLVWHLKDKKQKQIILNVIGQAIIIPPLVTIQMQMALVCEAWKIPYINLANIMNPDDITKKIEEVKPKIILCSIENVTDEAIQRRLQKLDVVYVAVDECQVIFFLISNHWTLIT